MALTRKYLKAMGIEDEKIDQIIDAHTETVNGLKDDIAKYKGNAEKLLAVQKEFYSEFPSQIKTYLNASV